MDFRSQIGGGLPGHTGGVEDYVHSGHALEDLLCAMEQSGEKGDGEAAESSSNVPAGWHLSFAGFGNAFTMEES